MLSGFETFVFSTNLGSHSIPISHPASHLETSAVYVPAAYPERSGNVIFP